MPTSIPIEQSVEQYIDSRVETSPKTRANHKYRLTKFTCYCDETGIATTTDISGAVIEDFRTSRLADDISIMTARNHLQTFRIYLRYLERIEACHPGLADKVIIPQVDAEDKARDTHLTHDRAMQIIDHLVNYKWASINHVVFHLTYHTGLRRSSLYALDLDDWQSDDHVLCVRNREHTPLKLADEGERNLTITDDRLADALDDYIDDIRHDVLDDNGRKPLFTSQYGRYHYQSLQKVFYKVTQPCRFSGICPVGKDIQTCEWRRGDHRSKCPESVSSHPIRRSAITHHLDADVPKHVVSERMNVDQDTLDQHYDVRTEEQKRQNREKYLDSV